MPFDGVGFGDSLQKIDAVPARARDNIAAGRTGDVGRDEPRSAWVVASRPAVISGWWRR
jgi:hypothetical protein